MIKKIFETLLLNSWDWLAFVISIIAICFAYKTLKSQQQTQINTTPIVNIETQKYLLEKINLSLFDAFIRLFAILDFLDSKNNYRPREWTLLEMRLPVENIHSELFYNDNDVFSLFDSFARRVQNYNLKLEIVNSQSINKQISTKEFKNGILSILISNTYIEQSCRKIVNEVYKDSNYESLLLKIQQDLCHIYEAYGLELKSSEKDYFIGEDDYSNAFSDPKDKISFRNFMNSLADAYRKDLENDIIDGMVKINELDETT